MNLAHSRRSLYQPQPGEIMSFKPFNRRETIKSLAALGAASSLGGLSTFAQAQKPLTVGVIYVGPRDDFGYNQAQAQAAAELKKMPGIKVVEEENVPETAAVQKSMTGMIAQDGASVLFPTSFGYFDPHMLAMAAKFPEARFAHCGGMWTEGKHPKNTGSYFGYIDECQYGRLVHACEGG
jgi:simple sugar transport system substrate-binding protein